MTPSSSKRLLLALFACLFLASACKNGKTADEPQLQGTISSYNEFGGVMLDVTEALGMKYTNERSDYPNLTDAQH